MAGQYRNIIILCALICGVVPNEENNGTSMDYTTEKNDVVVVNNTTTHAPGNDSSQRVIDSLEFIFSQYKSMDAAFNTEPGFFENVRADIVENKKIYSVLFVSLLSSFFVQLTLLYGMIHVKFLRKYVIDKFWYDLRVLATNTTPKSPL